MKLSTAGLYSNDINFSIGIYCHLNRIDRCEVRTIQQLVKKGFFTCDAFIRIADFLNQKQEQNTSKVVHMYDLIL